MRTGSKYLLSKLRALAEKDPEPVVGESVLFLREMLKHSRAESMADVLLTASLVPLIDKALSLASTASPSRATARFSAGSLRVEHDRHRCSDAGPPQRRALELCKQRPKIRAAADPDPALRRAREACTLEAQTQSRSRREDLETSHESRDSGREETLSRVPEKRPESSDATRNKSCAADKIRVLVRAVRSECLPCFILPYARHVPLDSFERNSSGFFSIDRGGSSSLNARGLRNLPRRFRRAIAARLREVVVGRHDASSMSTAMRSVADPR